MNAKDKAYIIEQLDTANTATDAAERNAAYMVLALHKSTPPECLAELFTAAFIDGNEPLKEALRKNKKLPVSALTSMDLQYA